MRAVIALSLVAVAACKADIPEGTFRCDGDRDCPSSLACVDGFCSSGGGGTDAGLDAARVDSGAPVDGGDAGGASDGSADAPAVVCPPLAGRDLVDVTGDILEEVTWSCDNTYRIQGVIVVRPGATLTIEPGVRVEGGDTSGLLVANGAQLVANGTAGAPIEFTRSEASSAWGGIVLLGSAPVAGGGGTITVLPVELGAARAFGGMAEDHSCGSLRYVRIDEAGADLGSGPLGALILGGCGTGTLIEHVHIDDVGEDGVEIYGGGARLRWVIVTDAQKQGLDWDRGWTGFAQYLIVRSADGDGGGIEGSTYPTSATPESSPTLFNVTLLGDPSASLEQDGIRLEQGSRGEIHNSIVDGFTGPCVAIDDPAIEALYEGSLPLMNSAVFDCGGGDHYRAAGTAFEDMLRAYNHDSLEVTGIDRSVNDFVPDTTANAAAWSDPNDDWFERVTHLGAVAPDDGSPWYGWTRFD